MRAKTTYKKPCPTECGNDCTTSHLMCGRCWSRVPKSLQIAAMATLKRKPGKTDFYYDFSDSAVAKAAFYAIQSVNPHSAKLQELAELAGLEIGKKEKELVNG